MRCWDKVRILMSGKYVPSYVYPNLIPVGRGKEYRQRRDDRRVTWRIFIKLELCQETLQDYITRLKDPNSSIEARNLVEIMIQLLSGISRCHERKICHRDLKESNSTSTNSCLTVALRGKGRCSCHPQHHSENAWLIIGFGFSVTNLTS